MKKNKILNLVLISLLTASFVTACGNKATTTDGAVPSGDQKAADGKLEPYKFKHYFSYDWWGIKPWGEDEASKHMKEKFNVDIEFSKPDADAEAKLNLMISSGNLPDAIMLERNPDLIKLAQSNSLLPLEELQKNNPAYDENILPQTQELLKIDGKLYSIPNWPRKAATGGNDAWMYNKKMYTELGSPDLTTFEGLYAYAKAVKEKFPTTADGQSVYPFLTGETADAVKLIKPFYRSLGGANLAETWYAIKNGGVEFAFRDDNFRKTVVELNKWFREGLFPETLFTDTPEQLLEKLTAGRVGLLFYDFSKNDENHFRQLMTESQPDNSYELLTSPAFPPAAGLPASKIYGDEKPSVGWNVTVISAKAKNPQRIFDLYTYMLTKEGSINMMYGPKGQLWDELDANGNPILKTPEEELSSDEKNRLGLWFWPMPGHSDNVDLTKFAVNAALPAEKRSWVISNQADVFTPLNVFTDEHVGLFDTISPQDDLGIKRKLIGDTIKSSLPKILIAPTEAESMKLYDELLKFCEDNGVAEIEKNYNVKYKANVELQGGTVYNK